MPKKYNTKKKFKGYELSEMSESETISETTGRKMLGYGDGSETVEESVLAPFMGPATNNIKTTKQKPLVRQAEAAQRAVGKIIGDGGLLVVSGRSSGDTELESTVEVDEAMNDARDTRISFMKKEGLAANQVIGDGNIAVKLDPVSIQVLSQMSPEDQERGRQLIIRSCSDMMDFVQNVPPKIEDPPVNIFVKSDDGVVQITKDNVLSLKENGKPIDLAFFDKVVINVNSDSSVSEEDKAKTGEWCMMAKEYTAMQRNLMEQLKEEIRANTNRAISTQRSDLNEVCQNFARYLSIIDANGAIRARQLEFLQGGLNDFSNHMNEGVTELTRRHAITNQKIISIEGILKEIAQNSLGQQQQLFRGLTENFNDLRKMLSSQQQDITSTQEQVNKIEKQIEGLKSQEGSLSQEQKEQMAEITARMTNMLSEIKDVREKQGEIKIIKEGLLETISAIRLLNEAVEGLKAKTIQNRDLLMSAAEGMAKLSQTNPEIKASADTALDIAARFGKVVIENQETSKAQLDSLKAISKSLVTLERSMVDSQKVQTERQQEILGAIREAVSRQNLDDVKSLVKDELANEMKPPISMADITVMINEAVERSMGKTSGLLIDEIRNLIGPVAAGGAPPPPPGGLNADAPVFIPKKGKFSFRETVALTPEAMEVEKNLALISAGGAPDPDDSDDDDFDEPPPRPVGTGFRGKWARRAKKTHDVSKRVLNWKKRAKLVGKVGSMVLGRERTTALVNSLLGGGAILGHMMSRRVASAIITSATGVGTIASAVLGILPAVKAISGYLARYLGMYDERSAETNRQLSRQTQLLEQAIARLTELRGAGDDVRFNRAPEVLKDLLNKIGEFKTATVPPVLRYGRLERMTPEERFRSVISLAGRSKPISLRTHGFVEIKKNIVDPALDNAADYKRATVKRRAARVNKIERRRMNDPLNKFFQGNW